ncbi:hypothetical protein BGZ99_000929 [Dissophora globulifera]|uniref:Zn(2)-C6 fungal-type domain-containing protein n=1 Tax=Dissophora globulifera TaxID=979702 RepID=A0A9P6UY16_9FUNG|nr:hypothetical protein BGZ99_000929 [Dissophora globulifera]
MSTSTLQLLPTSVTEIAQLDPATLASIPGVTYDLKRLKVYSSCLRCRAKKVKCDRKEPCSRCEKHNVECSYRELASVQLDIRQFQKHLTNPRVRKDGAGIITSTATPIITLPSGDTAVLSPSTTAAATLIAAAKATASTTPSSTHSNMASKSENNGNVSNTHTKKIHTDRISRKASSSTLASPVESAAPSRMASESPSSTDTESDTPSRGHSRKINAMNRAKVHKIHRRRASTKVAKMDPEEYSDSNAGAIVVDESDEDEEIERLVLRDDGDSHARRARFFDGQTDVRMSSDTEDGYDSPGVPIWRAQALGKHKQTPQEQDMAETFGLAAYLKAKEMQSGVSGETIDYDRELERALTQRLPTSFSRPDRSLSRARKYAQAGYNPSLPYARPSHCPLPSFSAQPIAPVAAICCCQIAARQGQAPGTCYFSGNADRSAIYEESSVSPPPQVIGYEQGESTRIAYSPSYQPSYTPKEDSHVADTGAVKGDWATTATSSVTPPSTLAPLRKLDVSSPPPSSSSSPRLPSIRMEYPQFYLPKLPSHPSTPASSDLSKFQVGRDGDKPLEIACKYNEPNVDAWDMIERPLSRTVPVTTKRGRSSKMEVGWILS